MDKSACTEESCLDFLEILEILVFRDALSIKNSYREQYPTPNHSTRHPLTWVIAEDALKSYVTHREGVFYETL